METQKTESKTQESKEQDKTKEFITTIQEQAKTLYISERERTLKDLSVTTDKNTTTTTKALNSEKVKSISVNNENNKQKITFYNGYVLHQLSKTFNIDFMKVYKEINKDFSCLVVLNKFLRTAIKDYTQELINNM